MKVTAHILRWVMLALFACLPVTAQIDAVEDDVSVIPPRPVGHILDAARWFTSDEKSAIEPELSRLYRENQIDVYLVTRAKLPPQGAETYTRKLGETWARAPVWCVIFHVPGDPAGFHVEAGGQKIDRAAVEDAIAEACQRARKENTEKDRMIAASEECSQALRFIYAAGKRYNERVVVVKNEMRSDISKKIRRRKIILVSTIAGLLALALLIISLVRYIRKKRFTFVFPDTVWLKRFQGPHSGGSGMIVNYRRKRHKKSKKK